MTGGRYGSQPYRPPLKTTIRLAAVSSTLTISDDVTEIGSAHTEIGELWVTDGMGTTWNAIDDFQPPAA